MKFDPGIVSPRDIEMINRIHQVTRHWLVLNAHTKSGWGAVYSDPVSSVLWFRTFEESHEHGGGYPTLEIVSSVRARQLLKDPEQ
jgi:hypothetical protein